MDISKIKRILIVRTDRIGDVVLSTPLITAARTVFPQAFIAMMVTPKTKEIIVANPHLNEIIIFDKHKTHRGFFKTLQFVPYLRSKKFDIALILHTTKRINIITFLAGIPIRVGYKRGKWDFLLTHSLPYTKRLGEKHESEYTLDILRSLGIDVGSFPLFMPIKRESEEYVHTLLEKYGLKKGERYIVLNPIASCPSKMWPKENFAKAADILIKDIGIRVVLFSTVEEAGIGEGIKRIMKNGLIFLCGNTTLQDLAALFKNASLVISNDSGPVHIASSVGTPVISIFSRNESGLSPKRWGPLGEKNVVIHKDVGCEKCLAHKCKKDFLCIKAIGVDEVVDAAKSLLLVT